MLPFIANTPSTTRKTSGLTASPWVGGTWKGSQKINDFSLKKNKMEFAEPNEKSPGVNNGLQQPKDVM